MGVGAAGPTNGVLIPPGAEQTLSSDVPPLLAFARVHEVYVRALACIACVPCWLALSPCAYAHTIFLVRIP
eukprot:1159402-Pelagomonas_calceolata.AAC.3